MSAAGTATHAAAVVHAVAWSHLGNVRARNEDVALLDRTQLRDEAGEVRAALAARPTPFLAAVCDGMGGHRGGAEASALVAERLRAACAGWAPDADAATLLAALRAELVAAHEALLARGEAEPELAGLGTTCTALVCSTRAVVLAHAGDSRCYRWRDGMLTLQTRDHTLRAATHDAHVARSILTNAIGGGQRAVHVDLVDLTARVLPGDEFLLCTDGAADEDTDDDALAAALAGDAGVGAVIGAASDRGGHDNATAVRVRIDAGAAAEG